MTDYFKLLNFRRSPWVDPAQAQARFLELSAAVHPDRVHNLGASEVAAANEKFAELNRAFATLRDHKERLHHLLMLETGNAPGMTQSIPSGFFDLASEVSLVCKLADGLIENLRKAKSPMVRVQIFEEALQQTERVQEAQAKVNSEKAKIEAELQRIAANWTKEKPYEGLMELAQASAMVAKCEAQLQERFAALASANL
jgi:curved DNA-binding protein CbpA